MARRRAKDDLRGRKAPSADLDVLLLPYFCSIHVGRIIYGEGYRMPDRHDSDMLRVGELLIEIGLAWILLGLFLDPPLIKIFAGIGCTFVIIGLIVGLTAPGS